MNCPQIQRRLLAAEQPDQVARTHKDHLDHCPGCQSFANRLLAIEQQIPTLLVPPSDRAQVVTQQILSSPVPSRPHRPIRFRPTWTRPSLKERALQKLSLALALAATLAVFAIGWWFWPHQTATNNPSDPIASFRAERGRRLATARTPQERVRVLANMVEEVQGKVRKHREDINQLDMLASFYRELVEDDLIAQAKKVPLGQRPALLHPIAARLRRNESEASRLAAEIPASARPLRVIATAAREGERTLRLLAEGKGMAAVYERESSPFVPRVRFDHSPQTSSSTSSAT